MKFTKSLKSRFFISSIAITIFLVVIVVFKILVFCRFDFCMKNVSKKTILSSSDIQIPKSNIDFPIRLKIPKIEIDVPIEPVTLDSKGAMDIPKDFFNVGWFSLGTRPGEIGSAVIDGHYGTRNTKVLTFSHLDKLQNGDKILIEVSSGSLITFIVRETRIYKSDAETQEIFNSIDGKSHLNLITCEGVWNKVTQSYPSRLVIFADKE